MVTLPNIHECRGTNQGDVISSIVFVTYSCGNAIIHIIIV